MAAGRGRRRRRAAASPVTFRVAGRVVDRRTGSALAGLRVEVWDKDVRFHSLLGSADTDRGGHFAVAFDSSYYGDYGGDLLPDVFYKVFRADELLLTTESKPYRDLATGASTVLLEVDAGQTMPQTQEVELHELGEAIAAAAAGMQQELARYPNALGAFVVDEMELNIPLHMRVSDLGQIMATVADGAGEQPGGAPPAQIRLRVRPVLGATQPPPVTSGQSLSDLDALPPNVVDHLRAHRIFSVDDLLRVTRAPAGRAALAELAPAVDVGSLLDRAAVLSMPAVPARVRTALLKNGVLSPIAFAKADATDLAARLSQAVGEPITADVVRDWQTDIQPIALISEPSRRPA